MAAIGKLVELRRRELGLTVEELTRQAHVTEEALIDLELGMRMPNTRDVIVLVSRALGLSDDRLIEAAGLGGDLDPGLSSAARRFRERLAVPVRLAPPESAALSEFMETLAAK